MFLIGLDPGERESAYVHYDGTIRGFAKVVNEQVLKTLANSGAGLLCIEKIASYGMAVGETTFETVYWSGRFAQAFPGKVQRITRLNVKEHLCHDSRAKDANIRQALIDRFGGKGQLKKGGVLYGISGDVWAALSVAVTAWDGVEGAR